MSQEVCPWNQRFARTLAEDSPFAPREVLRGTDARTLARDLLAMSQEEFSAAFKRSPMKRAKLAGLKRNAAVVLANIGNPDDTSWLETALEHPEPIVRAHAAREVTVSPAPSTDVELSLAFDRGLVQRYWSWSCP